jgi:hypothetical protein
MQKFWFHYNKPATQKAGHPVMTVHAGGVCHIVRHIVCDVPVCTRERSKQPRVVMAGTGEVTIRGGTAFIRAERSSDGSCVRVR